MEASTADNLRNGRTNVYYGVHTNTLSLMLYLVLLGGLPLKQCVGGEVVCHLGVAWVGVPLGMSSGSGLWAQLRL